MGRVKGKEGVSMTQASVENSTIKEWEEATYNYNGQNTILLWIKNS